MKKNLKIGLIILSIIGVSVGTYFAIQYYNLKNAYNRNLTPDDIIDIVNEKSKDLGEEMEEDPSLNYNCDTTDPLSDCFVECPNGQMLDEYGLCSLYE